MVRFFSSIIASLSGPARPRKTTPAPRRARLGLESLEGRALPSVSPIAVATPLMGQISTVYVAPAQVPSLQGYSFHLLSSIGKPPHDLAIQTETHLADGSASFTGTWTGGGPNGKSHEVLNGTLKYDANGNLEISFAWINGQGTQNTFAGTITTVHSPYGADNYLYGVHYHLEGDVTTPVPGGGPGHVSGDGALPPPVMKM